MQSWFLLLIIGQTVTIILGVKPMVQRYNDTIGPETQRIEKECLKEESIPGNFDLPHYSVTEHFLGQIQHATVIPKNAKCFFRCWYKKYGILKSNFVTSVGPIPELRRHMLECNHVAREWAHSHSNGDECEFAWSFYNCVHQTVMKCIT
ncbi:uncharacterized protein LOC119634156 [Glossina fuscipes]|uniref:Uncharacterized protein LOC119634156 n=2 Tax=Nemorhina TaxID=44051 RepID=A0A8U0WGL0_9MUSC|nr:uncharacterized protein LOC119634156 [Glossina fuscipes]KAI9586351.1 hypothetical protein GQX74_002198 [Glossina fuscipes]